MCGGGGGGDGGAARMEAERQERIKAATEEINKVFNGAGRDKMYSDQRSAVYDLNKRDVDQQAMVAQRNNKFGLARAGQLGGSLDVDSNAEINRVTNEGLLKAGGLADDASANLKANDERTRSSLISMAQSGIDTGTAASMALKGLDVNASQARGQLGGASVGQLFNNIGQAYYQNQVNQGYTQGMQPQHGGASSPQRRYAGTSGT